MEWISVKDRLPEKSFAWYLIATKDGDGNKITTLSFFELRECPDEDPLISWLAHNDKAVEYDEWEDVTHWMIKPEPPNDIEDK